MNKKSLLTVGFFAIGFLLLYWWGNRGGEEFDFSEEERLTEAEKQLEEALGTELDWGDEVERVEMTDKAGKGSVGMATREEKEGAKEYTVLADLPVLEEGEFYQSWLGKDGEWQLMATLEERKGGWFAAETVGAGVDFDKLMVSVEKVADAKPETELLEGSF